VPKPPAYPLESVDRALRLVLMLQAGEVLTVTQAAAQLDIAPSTAHRLLGALCFREFAVQEATRRYSAGPALASRSAAITSAALRLAAAPALQALHGEFEETVHLMVLQGTNVLFVDGIEADRVLRVGLRIRGTMPAYCSAGGKAMLAALPLGEVETLHRDGLPSWPTSKVSGVNVLKRNLAEVRGDGYAVNYEETEIGVCGVGAAILDATQRPVAALTIAIPTARFDKRRVSAMGRELRRVAAESAERLTLLPR
jgi:DNA-binding IclR family transcriptional regulator